MDDLRADRVQLRGDLPLNTVTRFAVLGLILATSGCAGSPEEPSATHNARADYAELMIACLAEAGFEAEAQGSGVIIESSGGQQDVIAEASKACEHELGYDTITRLSDSQLGDLYDFEEETRDCLIDLGYDVTLPSRQVFIEADYEDAMLACPPAVGIYDPYTG